MPELTPAMTREIDDSLKATVWTLYAQRQSREWLAALRAENVYLRNRVEMLERRDARHQQEIHQYRLEVDAARPEIARLKEWKASATALLERYQVIADTFTGELGEGRVSVLARGVEALRGQAEKKK